MTVEDPHSGGAVRDLTIIALGLALATMARADEFKPLPGVISQWNGFARHDFPVDGAGVIVVEPAEPLPGRPWAWRGEFFGAFPNADIELLKAGRHLASMKGPDLFGSPKAVEIETPKDGDIERAILEAIQDRYPAHPLTLVDS